MTTDVHYHVGHNLPGYLPESDVDCYETWADAKAGMIDTLLYHADSIGTWADEHDCDDVPCPSYGDDCPWQQAEALSGTAEDLNLSAGPEWGDIVAGQSYWITATPASDCEEVVTS